MSFRAALGLGMGMSIGIGVAAAIIIVAIRIFDARGGAVSTASPTLGTTPVVSLRCAKDDKIDITKEEYSGLGRGDPRAAITIFNTCNRALEGTVVITQKDAFSQKDNLRATFYLANIQPGRQYRLDGKVDVFDYDRAIFPGNDVREIDVRAVGE